MALSRTWTRAKRYVRRQRAATSTLGGSPHFIPLDTIGMPTASQKPRTVRTRTLTVRDMTAFNIPSRRTRCPAIRTRGAGTPWQAFNFQFSEFSSLFSSDRRESRPRDETPQNRGTSPPVLGDSAQALLSARRRGPCAYLVSTESAKAGLQI
eukprot:scaffold107813_cov63-Phaeocystis_antarctica.AAC.1